MCWAAAPTARVARHELRLGDRRSDRRRDSPVLALHATPTGEVLMTVNGWLQIAFYSIALLLVTKPLGIYILKVYDGSLTWLRPVERLLYLLAGVDPEE